MHISGLKGVLLTPQQEQHSDRGVWDADILLEAPGSVLVRDVSSPEARPVLQASGPQSVCRAGETVVLLASTSSAPEQQTTSAQASEAKQPVMGVMLTCKSLQEAGQLVEALQQHTVKAAAQRGAAAADLEAGLAIISQEQQQEQQAGSSLNSFDAKTDKGSAELYFHYYGMLQHQQNMLQDMTRTGTYHAAITENRADFEGKVVMDVGAGSGILSLFAAQAGARKVYAVEASGMAKFAQQLASKNPGVGQAVQVCHSKIEELQLPDNERVDVLVSEPMGTLLVNERMLETYLFARDHFLKPGGKMFPHLGRIHVAAFSDAILHNELLGKAVFWQQTSFYGLDMSALYQPAVDGYFQQVVVDAFDPSVLVSDCATKVFDFSTMKEDELHDITIPLELLVAHPCTLHGLATWFDVLFNGSTSQRWLSTAPGLPATHWFQLRCVLQQPLLVLTPNSTLTGRLRLVAHARQSYDIHVELEAPPIGPGMPKQQAQGTFDMKEPYYRQLTTWAQVQPVPQTQMVQQQQLASIPGLTLSVPAAAGAHQESPLAHQPVLAEAATDVAASAPGVQAGAVV